MVHEIYCGLWLIPIRSLYTYQNKSPSYNRLRKRWNSAINMLNVL